MKNGCTFRFFVTSFWSLVARYVKFRRQVHHKLKKNLLILSLLTYLSHVPLHPIIEITSLFLGFVLLVPQYFPFALPTFFLIFCHASFFFFSRYFFLLFFLSPSRPLSFFIFLCLPLCLFSFLFFFPCLKLFTWIFSFTLPFCLSVSLISFFLLFFHSLFFLPSFLFLIPFPFLCFFLYFFSYSFFPVESSPV